MTLGETLGLSESRERLLTRFLQFVLLAVFAYGLVALRWGVAVNAGFAFAVTLLPAVVRREYGYSMDPGLVAWITIAVVLHTVGVLGPYKRYPWYDELTHAVSATIIAGLGYASFRAFERHSEEIAVPSTFRSVVIVVFVLATGVVWEILEFAVGRLAAYVGAPPPLVVFGVDDVVTDLIFNVVGAVVVVLWGTDRVGGLVSFVRHRLDSVDDE